MLSNDKINRFFEDIAALDIKFKNAEISSRTGYTKGNVSDFLNKRKPVPEKFIDTFYKMFPECTKKVPRGTSEVTMDLKSAIERLQDWQAGVDATLKVIIDELGPSLSKASGKSNASVLADLKRDIQLEKENRLKQLKKEV